MDLANLLEEIDRIKHYIMEYCWENNCVFHGESETMLYLRCLRNQLPPKPYRDCCCTDLSIPGPCHTTIPGELGPRHHVIDPYESCRSL